MIHVRKSTTVLKSRQEVYEFWRDFRNLPQFMQHLKDVDVIDERRSHWTAAAPGGTAVEWDAVITLDLPGDKIEWSSTPGSEIPNTGSVRFLDAPGDRGTEIHVSLRYDPPAGKLGEAVAKLFGEEPAQQVRDDLRRLKQVLETGEVVRSDGSLEGAGQGALKQRAAQAPESTSEANA